MENTVYDTHRRVVSLDSSLQGSVTNLNKTRRRTRCAFRQ